MEQLMACASPAKTSTKETTNFARLCRLLVDLGTEVLREKFNGIHSPANLHAVLARETPTLQRLKRRKIISPIQWGKLFPVIPSSVSSASFDITLLMVLFRNICGLAAPATGWDALPVATDTTPEADLARVKYLRNTVFAHTEHASIDNATFSSHWKGIREIFVRLGGVKYGAAVDLLETECMDPEAEEHYIELLNQWKKDEDNVKDKLEGIGSGIEKVMKKLEEITTEGVSLKPKVEARGTITCKAKYHGNEPVEFFCEDCRVCICHKCGQTSHNNHSKLDVKEAAEQRKTQMAKLFDRAKTKAADIQEKMKKQAELTKKNEDEMNSAEKMMTESMEDKIRLLNEHRAAMKRKIDETREAEQNKCATSMEKFEMLSAELKKYVECGLEYEGLDILQAECESVLSRCEDLLNAEEIETYRPKHVCYDVSKETLRFALGDMVAFHVKPSQSLCEAEDDFNKAELAGTESDLTATIRQAGRNSCDVKEGKTTSKTKRIVKEMRRDCEFVNNIKSHESQRVGVHDVVVEANNKPLTAVPGVEQVAAHTYKKIRSFGGGKLISPVSIAVSAKDGNIAIADRANQCIYLYNPKWKYLRTLVDKGTGDEIIDWPQSVAFTVSGDIIVIHGIIDVKMSVFTERGNFITHITKHLIRPSTVSVGKEGNLVVCDSYESTVKVLSPDGKHLIQTLRDPHSDDFPVLAFHHEDKFFACYRHDSCIRVFSEDGQLLQKIGCKGTGDGQLRDPQGIAIDRFGNLVVCDTGNNRIQAFSSGGKFLNSVHEERSSPKSVAVTKNGDLLVCSGFKRYIHVLRPVAIVNHTNFCLPFNSLFKK